MSLCYYDPISKTKLSKLSKEYIAGNKINETINNITLLHHACIMSENKIAKKLLNHGADPNDHKFCISEVVVMSPLECAIKFHNDDLVTMLLSKGAEVRDNTLDLCLRNGPNFEVTPNFKLVRKVLQAGAGNCPCWCEEILNTNLQTCCSIPDCPIDIIQTLIDQGEKIDSVNLTETTPLWNACQCGHVAAADALIAAGCRVNNSREEPAEAAYNQVMNDCSLMITDDERRKRAWEAKDAAEKKYGGLYGQNELFKNGFAPLHVAAANGHLQIAQSLIRSGADIHAVGIEATESFYFQKDHNHPCHYETPLRIAIRKGHTDVAEVLSREALFCRRRPLMLMRPHVDHETNRAHKLSALGNIVAAGKGNTPNSSNNDADDDDVLWQLKLKIAKYF